MVWQVIKRSSQGENETTRRTISYCWQTSFIIWSHLLPTGEHTCFAGTATVNRSPCLHSSHRWLESVRRVVHKEIGCNKWKKTLAYLLVLPGSRARIVRCGGCYDPQLVKRSSEWVSRIGRAKNWFTNFLSRCQYEQSVESRLGSREFKFLTREKMSSHCWYIKKCNSNHILHNDLKTTIPFTFFCLFRHIWWM